MNELQIFSYQSHEVRTVEMNCEPWFVLKDVCDVLGLSTPARVAERLDSDEVSQAHLIDSVGRSQEMTIISESGLYNVILRSDKPEAKPCRSESLRCTAFPSQITSALFSAIPSRRLALLAMPSPCLSVLLSAAAPPCSATALHQASRCIATAQQFTS